VGGGDQEELVWGGVVLGRGEDDHASVEAEMEDGGSVSKLDLGLVMSFCSILNWSGRFLNVLYFDTEGVAFYGYLDI
jgi:hypothetical protein